MTGTSPNSAENPWPVRTVNTKIADWIHRLGQIWVEGQVTQISRRPGTRTAFLTLRDPAADISISVTCSPDLLSRTEVPLTDGSHVVVLGRPSYYTGRGTVSLRVSDIRAVGVGELLLRIERLRQLLAAEGLFDARLKRPLPFLPRSIGLISGRASAAQRDVVSVATDRWSAVRFDVREAPVQGPTAVARILTHLADLDAHPDVEVIIIARGGGSVEDLLPFSDEALLRAVSRCRTPVVSAIGHEPDNPLLDLVADLRAATPTDAAKRVVPDVEAELAGIDELRRRSAQALRNWVRRETGVIDGLRRRPVLARPGVIVDQESVNVAELLRALRRDVLRHVDTEDRRHEHLAARLSTLGPAQTLARGYAVVQRTDTDVTHVVSTLDDLPAGAELRIRVADGAARATVTATEAHTSTSPDDEGDS
ncbi:MULTISPECIES: exodeoxyribonuclease VII large subunit [Gordonia]|uniref:Exodeoxyribonuclease 7 large subunit n=2 Tax=Gordonia alkanivorans TaxID=84096 RepID=F9VSI7_9ACTN|nr:MULTISPECIES: exodeoxyribonuclease VII large subunit [Gordonia]ETA08694.1 exodeoxyribonuclease VII large subunit [Gordonia alkanivorans CGMCC 6845]MDH3005359.1 exodeoxyribonuclease VII large subunit [Gordonia alkanivorans]MDH3010344.1 exodeoxyribonuclease VII large subunit [Gordonia alkanivorans]MDH3014771.1 exodeoxyribonuclease VII large subunit [Gordonia alkanivorans]MDH3019138.1 exodeoxyribonuclease VII large subunit [Gordonia alkanivorans]